MNVRLDERRKNFLLECSNEHEQTEVVKYSKDPLRDYVSSHVNTTGRAFCAIVLNIMV